ncbi:MAG: FtsX-like permease family protein [Planctomycetota bacterium]
MAYIWRNLMQRKVRSSLCLLGVAVPVAMIVALISISEGMRRSLNNYMETSGASLVVFSKDAADLAFSRVKQEQVDAIVDIDGVESISRSNFMPVMNPRASIGTIPLFGRFPEERIMQKYESALTGGRLLRAKNEVLLGSFAAKQCGYKLGDSIELFGAPVAGIEKFEVVGTFQSAIPWENLGMIVHGDVIRIAIGKESSYSLIFLYTDAGATDRVKNAVESRFPKLIAMRSGEFTDRFAAQMDFMDDFIMIVTIIALVVGVLGVVNTMMMSVGERRREIGTLRAVGWSKARVLGIVVGEGLLISMLGGGMGLLIGVAGTEALLGWFPDGLLIATYLPSTFTKGFSVGVVTGLIGAFYPGWRACQVQPVEAMRYE